MKVFLSMGLMFSDIFPSKGILDSISYFLGYIRLYTHLSFLVWPLCLSFIVVKRRTGQFFLFSREILA